MPQKPIETICSSCGGKFLRKPFDIARAIKKSGTWRCRPCSQVFHNKARGLPEQSRRMVMGGYVEIKVNGSWIREHRYVAEQRLGRKLLPYEIVHHKDGKKDNNKPENLEVMTRAEHTILHSTGRIVSQETRDKIRVRSKGRPSPKKLTEESVLNIRAEYVPGIFSYSKLAEKYKVTRRAIACVVKRLTWSHI